MRFSAHHSLLLSISSPDELRRWVGYFERGLSSSLPGTNVSHSALAHSVVELMETRGHSRGDAWWRALVQHVPGRSRDILTVARMYGVNL